MIRYNGGHHGEARKERQVHEKEQEGGVEDGAQNLKTRRCSLGTPGPHAHGVPPETQNIGKL